MSLYSAGVELNFNARLTFYLFCNYHLLKFICGNVTLNRIIIELQMFLTFSLFKFFFEKKPKISISNKFEFSRKGISFLVFSRG